MDSALRPREIQSRIRAGQSLEEVARIAGVPAERIEAYAAPVLAERGHVAGLALAATVRRRGESGAHRTLQPVVRERLRAHQVDPDTVDWDAWRNEDRRWSVQASWIDTDDESRSATFYFDLHSRFSIAADDEARWLIADGTAAAQSSDEESDALALVRAVSPAIEPAGIDEPTVALRKADSDSRETSEQSTGPAAPISSAPAPGDTGSEGPGSEASDDLLPRSVGTPLEIGEAVEAEIDSYGLIPDGRSELDVLYDMLGGIAEDSINIYAGLADPVVPEETGRARADSPAEVTRNTEQPGPPEPQLAQPPAQSAASESTAGSTPAPQALPESDRSDAAPDENQARPIRNQPALTEDTEPTTPLKPGAAKRRRKGRAQVPSWEEIMFGSPKAD